MNNKIAEIIGVSPDTISELPEDIRDSMKNACEAIEIKSDSDRKELFNVLYDLWQKGYILAGLQAVSETSGIPFLTLSNLDYDTQKSLVFEYMADSSQTALFYEITNKALAVMELDKIARLISVPMRELRKLPVEIQEKMCGTYAMEYDENSTNAELTAVLREMML